MLIKVVSIDTSGFYTGDVLLEEGQEVPANCISVEVPEGFYLPKWNGTAWVEGRTQAEIDAIKNVVVPKTPMELLKEQVTESQGALDFIVMNF